MSETFHATEEALYFDRHGDVWRYSAGEFVHVKRADEDTPDPSANRWVESAAKIARDFGPMTHLSDRTGSAHESLLLWALQGKNTDDDEVLHRAHALVERHRAEVRAEILGTDLNPSRLVLDAQSYRRLADDVLATMTDPDRWDLDGDEGWICAQYVKHMAAQLALASEFRVSLPEGLGGYGELVVRRESTDSDRWAVTDGAVSGLRAWVEPDGWQYVAEVGRVEAFAYGLDEALALAEDVARIEQERHDARIRAHHEGGAS